MSQQAQKMSHVVLKIEPFVISFFSISIVTIFVKICFSYENITKKFKVHRGICRLFGEIHEKTLDFRVCGNTGFFILLQ